MKKLILFLILLLALPCYGQELARMNPYVAGSVAAIVASCGLLSDTFEAADGTDSDTYGWTDISGNPGTLIEIDTAQYYAGASSMLFDNSVDDTEYIIGKTFSGPTTGKYVISFRFRVADVETGTHVALFAANAGATWTWASSFALFLRTSEDDLQAYYAGGWNTLSAGTITVNTWHYVEIELDMDSNVFDLWLNGSQVGTDVAFANNIDPDYIFLFKDKNTNAINDSWTDNLCVQSGAR